MWCNILCQQSYQKVAVSDLIMMISGHGNLNYCYEYTSPCSQTTVAKMICLCYYMHMHFQNAPQWLLSFDLYAIPVMNTGHHHPLLILGLINARDFTVAEGCALDTSMLAFTSVPWRSCNVRDINGRVYSLLEFTRRNVSFSSILIAEGDEWPIGGSVEVHAFHRKSGQFLMLKYSYAPVLSICTPYIYTSSSLSSDLLLVLPNMVIEYAQWHTAQNHCREWSIEVAMY